MKRQNSSQPEQTCGAPPEHSGTYSPIHFWMDPLPCETDQAADYLGGKGTSLALLHQAGLSVPPAFTIPIEFCRLYHANHRRWVTGMWQPIQSALTRLEELTGRKMGDGSKPLTVAIRSGAAQSMPGLMATFLHCGLTESLVRSLNEDATWEAFADFLESYGPIRAAGRPVGPVSPNAQ